MALKDHEHWKQRTVSLCTVKRRSETYESEFFTQRVIFSCEFVRMRPPGTMVNFGSDGNEETSSEGGE